MGETLQKRAEDAEATARILAKDVRAWSDKCDELREALAAARRECDAAKDALARYGEHDSDCPRHKTWNGVLAASQRTICSCGLSAALAAPATSEEGKR